MLLMEEKRFPEVTGGVRYCFRKFGKGEGVKPYLVKMENLKGWGGYNGNSLCGGGQDIFWKHTMTILWP